MNEIKLTTAQDIRSAVDAIASRLKDKGGLKTVFSVACGYDLSADCRPLFYLFFSFARLSLMIFIWLASISSTLFSFAQSTQPRSTSGRKTRGTFRMV